MAERAIRQLAVQRKISGSFFKRVALQYLLLLAISQTCRFQGKSFLKFLLSKGKDVDEFRRSRAITYSAPVGPRSIQALVPYDEGGAQAVTLCRSLRLSRHVQAESSLGVEVTPKRAGPNFISAAAGDGGGLLE